MAAQSFVTISERWIRDRLRFNRPRLGDVRSLNLPGTYQEKIRHLGNALNNFVGLKSLDLCCNALISVEGVQCLKMLERLILYYNCIPSIEEVKGLYELPALRELDLRLNPLTRSSPHYRLRLVHAMPSLRKLDARSVRGTERKAAAVQFSSEPLPQQKPRLRQHADQSNPVLTFVAINDGGQNETRSLSDLIHKEAESQFTHLQQEPRREKSKVVPEQRNSAPKQELAKSILRYPPSEYGPHMKEPSSRKSSTSVKVTEKPKVTFGPSVGKCTPAPVKKQKEFTEQTRFSTDGHLTPRPGRHRSPPLIDVQPQSPRCSGLDPTSPILHPPRLTYSSFNMTEGGASVPKQTKGGRRKPLKMLLNLVDNHWTGERPQHHNKSFLSQAVQILCMMENGISTLEAEVKSLRREAGALKHQAAAREEEHQTQMCSLTSQLQEAHGEVGKLNEQLRVVLMENAARQKRLIKLRQHLKSMLRSSPNAQVKEAHLQVEELKKEIDGLKEKLRQMENVKELSTMQQQSRRSLTVSNECLRAELKGIEKHDRRI